MNRKFAPVFVLLILALAALACGESSPTATPAPPTPTPLPADAVNLSLADLGSGWSLLEEQVLDQITAFAEEDAVVDANLRSFTTEQGEIIASLVGLVKTVESAKQTMQDDFAGATATELQAQLPGLTFEELDPPSVGDETILIGGSVPDLDYNVYVISFRKGNVIAMLFLAGPEEFATESSMEEYARKLEAKIH